jgi:hypothetical protein
MLNSKAAFHRYISPDAAAKRRQSPIGRSKRPRRFSRLLWDRHLAFQMRVKSFNYSLADFISSSVRCYGRLEGSNLAFLLIPLLSTPPVSGFGSLWNCHLAIARYPYFSFLMCDQQMCAKLPVLRRPFLSVFSPLVHSTIVNGIISWSWFQWIHVVPSGTLSHSNNSIALHRIPNESLRDCLCLDCRTWASHLLGDFFIVFLHCCAFCDREKWVEVFEKTIFFRKWNVKQPLSVGCRGFNEFCCLMMKQDFLVIIDEDNGFRVCALDRRPFPMTQCSVRVQTFWGQYTVRREGD